MTAEAPTIASSSSPRSALPPAFRATGITPAGTTLFDGRQASKGYALNATCYSFNDATNRTAFLADEPAYCRQYGLNGAQTTAIHTRNVLGLLAAAGNTCGYRRTSRCSGAGAGALADDARRPV